jgi:POT family proton-dependent oligopeptide transporter
MVNLGASFGPIVMGKLSRTIGWDSVFYVAAGTIALMFLITVFFYKEPKREIEGVSLKQKFKDIGIALSDVKFSVFIVILGLFFWMPFWAFFNTMAVYINDYLDTHQLFLAVKSVLGGWFTKSFLASEIDGVWKINAEAISHTGYIILIFQVLVSRIFEKRLQYQLLCLGY